MTGPESIVWRRCGVADADQLGRFNARLAVDEGGAALGSPDWYARRMTRWLAAGRYEAAVAEGAAGPVGYVLWREDDDYGDVFVRQFFVASEFRGAGLGRRLFEDAVAAFWAGRPLRLDVYDSNPGGLAFWRRLGFEPYSRLLRRAGGPRGVTSDD